MLKTKQVVFSAVALLICLAVTNATAMPNFARKYGVPCLTCHTQIPALNEVGYKFRAAGFRWPDDIGKAQDQKFELGDYFGVRIQGRYDTQVTNQPNGAPQPNIIAGVPQGRVTTNDFSFQEYTFYPLTGSWGKYLGSLAELSGSPEDVIEVENAYVRFVYGNGKKFFTGRLGVFHPWEGFGASDRPYSNARTLFQTTPISAGGRAVPFVFQPWGLDEAGLEVGGDIHRLSLRAAVLGGTLIRWEEESAAFLPFPAQTGPWKGANQAIAALTKPFDSPAHNTPDFSFNVTYILHEHGGGISALYYRGNVATPTSCVSGTAVAIGGVPATGLTATPIGAVDPVTGLVCGVTAASAAEPFGSQSEFETETNFNFTNTGPGAAYRNNFDRMQIYASYPIGKRFLPQAGFMYGRDTNPNHSKFDSKGAFGDIVFFLSDYVTPGFRFDWFKPKYGTGAAFHNQQWAVTPYVNIPLQNGLQFIAEYQHRDFEIANSTHHRQNDTFQVRLIFIK